MFNHAAPRRGSVDDLAREVFLRLQRYSDDVVVENPQAYLFRIAANVANEWGANEWDRRLRGRIPHRHRLDRSQNQTNDAAGVGQQLQRAVDRLPSGKRQVLLLHVNERLTYKQIAVRLGSTCRAVLKDLAQAYATLRLQLQVEGL